MDTQPEFQGIPAADTSLVAAAAKKRSAAKRLGRPPTGRGDRLVLGVDVIAQLEAVAVDLVATFGFKPSAGQVVSYVLAQREATKP